MKFKIYKDKKGEFRWSLIASNGKKIADSAESYKRKRGCLRTYESLLNLVCDGRKDAIKLIET